MRTRADKRRFRKEKEEAKSWDAHPEAATRLLKKAFKQGTVRRSRLSPEELGLLVKRLAAASDPVEAARLKERLTRGFYGI
jgi:N-acetylglucosamine kinase-like BadF-type ATPase